jgi:hypothetical protein
MSDFIGANLYYIVSPLDRELRIDLAAGKPDDGTAVAVWYTTRLCQSLQLDLLTA